jgi:hypothetical protein
VSFLLIREIPGSDLSLEMTILAELFDGFPQPLQANAGIVSSIRPGRLSSTSFPIDSLYYFFGRYSP